jgi:D-alanyl-D-alanine carboxypeptidase
VHKRARVSIAALLFRCGSARHSRVLILAAVLLSSVSGQDREAGSSSAPSTEIKRLLENQVQSQHLVGIAAIVFRSHTIVGLATAGVKRQGESTPLGSTDLFHLGSNTKAITATMIARLVEAGKLSWTTTALEIFPELSKRIHPAFRHITMEQLLSHHAGIPPFDTVTVHLLKNTWPKLSGSAMEQRYRFAALVLRHAPAVTPGTKGLYSNADFAIAAAMAERKTGSSWEDLVTSQVLEPLGAHAIFGFPLSAGRNQPWGHFETDKGFIALQGGVIQVPIPYMLPSGGMAMTLGDYVKFLQMNLKGLRGEDSAFLSAKTIQRLHSSTMHDQYALGWGAVQIDGVPESTHSGSDGSFYALVALQPTRDEGVAVVLNSSGERSGEAARALLRALMKEYAVGPSGRRQGWRPTRNAVEFGFNSKGAVSSSGKNFVHGAGCMATATGGERRCRERSQSSTRIVLMEKPIQNARPKNCRGSKCVSELVAKNTAMTGRVVAMPRSMPIARDSQRCF